MSLLLVIGASFYLVAFSTVRLVGDARTVDVHIRRLREKIERNPDEPEFIFTKWKVGYYFTDKD